MPQTYAINSSDNGWYDFLPNIQDGGQ